MPPPPPLLALQGVCVTFGGRPLFEGIDLALARGDKVCLIGRNASGKSTMLRLIAGELEPDRGLRTVRPGTRIGFLPQEPDIAGWPSVAAYVGAGLPEDDRDQEHRVAAVLDRLGLDGDRDLATLSGGKLRRAALARALVGEPDVLLLDEPTNHLDLPTIEWLEGVLDAYRGALLLISHDRAFLTRLGHRTVWLDRGRLVETGRPFAGFAAWQEETLAAEEAAARKLDARIASELLWMREGLSARRRRNMGRVRAIAQMRRDRADRVVHRQAKLEAAEAEASGKVVIEAEGVVKSFVTSRGLRPLVNNFSVRILRGDRVGVIGPNGAGKTTLIRLLTGELPPDAGTVRLGSRLEVAVFDQRRAALDPEATIRQTLCPYGGDGVVVGGESRHVAGYIRDFLFDTGQLDSPVRTLSGGERNRLLLAKLFARPSNLLVLDEPTNDLDMETLDVLEDLLGSYEGTLLLVSHDRDFLDRLVTSTLVMEGDGRVTEYPGGHADYLAQRPVAEPARPVKPAAKPADKAEGTEAARPRRKLGYQQQRELERLPAEIEGLTRAVHELEAKLADPTLYGRDPGRYRAVAGDLDQARAALALAEDRWIELEGLREELESAS